MMKNLLVVTVTLGILSSMVSAEMIWIEGEKPLKHTMNRHPWWYDRVKKTELSGGDWISNFSKDKQGTASYGFRIQESGDYNLWLRANPVSSAMSFKIDQSDWKSIEMIEGSCHDQINIAADDKLAGAVVGGAVFLQLFNGCSHRLDVGRPYDARQRVAGQFIGLAARGAGQPGIGEQYFLLIIQQKDISLRIIGHRVQKLGLFLQLLGLAAQGIGVVYGAHAAAVTPGRHQCCGDKEQ